MGWQRTFDKVDPFPIRRGRFLSWPRRIDRRLALFEIRGIARAIGVDLAFDAHHQLGALMSGEAFRIVMDGGFAIGAQLQAFAVEGREEQADIWVFADIAEGAEGRVAVLFGNFVIA